MLCYVGPFGGVYCWLVVCSALQHPVLSRQTPVVPCSDLHTLGAGLGSGLRFRSQHHLGLQIGLTDWLKGVDITRSYTTDYKKDNT